VYQKLGGVENRWAAVAQWQNATNLSYPAARPPDPATDSKRLSS